MSAERNKNYAEKDKNDESNEKDAEDQDHLCTLRLDKKTRIVSTLGPASESSTVIKQLLLSGVNMFRLNFSHGSQDEKAQVITLIRSLSKELGLHVAILADMQGPKFRLGEFENHQSIHVKKDDTLSFKKGTIQRLSNRTTLSTGTPHAHILIDHLQVNHRVLINDGSIILRVIKRISPDEVEVRVVVGGEIGEKKGINVPDLLVPVPALTEKDKEDAVFALNQDIEYMALSFVQKPQDIHDLRKHLLTNIKGGIPLPKIIAKIEKPQAIDVIDDIIEVVDGIMVARGDLGVECSYEKVPVFQKMIIHKCNLAGIPVITATQMLESMIHSAIPTRAEASDVFNAVMDGSDAVMLSGETATGDYPVEAVQAMAAICISAEKQQAQRSHQERPQPQLNQNQLSKQNVNSLAYAIGASAVTAAQSGINAKAIILVAVQYEFVLYVSKLRPPCPIVVVTFSIKLARLVELFYCCQALVIPESDKETSTDELLGDVEQQIVERTWLDNGDLFVFACADAPYPGLRNTLQLGRFGATWKKTHGGERNWLELVKKHTHSHHIQ